MSCTPRYTHPSASRNSPRPLSSPKQWQRRLRGQSYTRPRPTNISLVPPRRSGSVCLDVINQTWSPMYDMVNIFEVFLPQLLRYPNPTDPLNGEAAALMMRDAKSYEAKVKGTHS